MGDVYLARRADGEFDMLAAVKVVRRGFDSDHTRRRFASERQILARLEHPSIARLLDGGINADGLPYLVMEFVEGEPLDAHAATRGLPVHARLDLFLKVCEAVRHAHGYLIVHRDLKPQNILVTPSGDVKLLDFGIAKLLDETGAGEETGTANVLLTPRYASPEQILGLPVTVQSDVYALGVILFELLCGRSPYANTQRTVAEWFRAIESEEAPLASSVAPGTAAREIAGDIDQILAKALAKSTAERYPSVEQLALDITRHLAGLPVSARPLTLWYQAGKFVRRHRAGVAAAVMVVLALGAGLAATLWQARVAHHERLKAEKRFEQTRELARLTMFDLFDAVRDLPGSTPTQKLMLTRALAHYERLASEARSDPAMLAELARGYARMADLYGNPYTSNLGETEQALKTYRRGISLLAPIPEGAGSIELETARAFLHRGLGEVIAIRGDAPAGVAELRRAAAILERLFAANPSAFTVANELASVQGTLGDHLGGIGSGVMLDRDGTRRALERALELNRIVASLPGVPPADLLRAQRGVAVHLLKLGNLALVTEDNAQAADRLSHAAAALTRLPPAEMDKTENLRLKTAILKSQAEALIGLDKPAEAAQVVTPAVETLGELWRRDPENRQFRHGYLMVLRTRGDAWMAAGLRSNAVSDFIEGERLAWELLKEDPANATSRNRWEGFRNGLTSAGVAPPAR
jgi:non-specific serine/threonine protein kinase/serine/threonine-protein kinase